MRYSCYNSSSPGSRNISIFLGDTELKELGNPARLDVVKVEDRLLLSPSSTGKLVNKGEGHYRGSDRLDLPACGITEIRDVHYDTKTHTISIPILSEARIQRKVKEHYTFDDLRATARRLETIAADMGVEIDILDGKIIIKL
jgi:hypothetical protein